MGLSNLVHRDGIVADMKALTHWDAICELVDVLFRKENLSSESKETILTAFREREDECSTGMGGGIAIPHIYSENVREVVAILGRSFHGVDFGAIDNGPVHLLVLLVIPKDQFTLNLKTLALIARTLKDREIFRELLDPEHDEDELFEILKKIES